MRRVWFESGELWRLTEDGLDAAITAAPDLIRPCVPHGEITAELTPYDYAIFSCLSCDILLGPGQVEQRESWFRCGAADLGLCAGAPAHMELWEMDWVCLMRERMPDDGGY